MFNENQIAHIKLKLREERYMYLGILSEYQTISKDLVQPIDYTKLNPYQHFLFKRVLHGFKMYKKEEVEKMHPSKRSRISRVWKRGQDVLNCWKQEICNREANKVFAIFVNSKDAMALAAMDPKDTDPSYKNTMSLKDLKITYEDVIIKFMSEKLLPKNFLEINKPV